MTTNTLDLMDKFVINENVNFNAQLKKFNESKKIKFLFLRCRKEPSWFVDVNKIWGPDIEAEYITDVLTDDGSNNNNIEFLSIPKYFDFRLINGCTILAYSSNEYDVNYINHVVVHLKPTVLLHLSDETGARPEYIHVFNKVKLVYRQHKFLYKKEFGGENKPSIKYLPLGYHSWDKKYYRTNHISIDKKKYRWCYSGTPKNNRLKCIEKLSFIKPNFVKRTGAFETTIMYQNSVFAFCPEGNVGLETTRIYGAIFNGCIPIILTGKFKMENFKTTFEIPVPFFFATNLNEVINIIQNTPINVIIKTRNECFKWIKDISNVIRTNIITACTINKLCMN